MCEPNRIGKINVLNKISEIIVREGLKRAKIKKWNKCKKNGICMCMVRRFFSIVVTKKKNIGLIVAREQPP